MNPKDRQAGVARDGGEHALNELLGLLGRRWSLRIIRELYQKSVGFRELQARCDGMSASVLNQRLGELVEAGIVERDAEEPLYRVSRKGEELAGVLMQLKGWALKWAASERIDRDPSS